MSEDEARPTLSALLPKSEELEMFVVYKGTADYPKSIVVRRWFIDAAGGCRPQDGLPSIIAPSVERAREGLAMLRSDLSRLDRHPDDDACIVETWV